MYCSLAYLYAENAMLLLWLAFFQCVYAVKGESVFCVEKEELTDPKEKIPPKTRKHKISEQQVYAFEVFKAVRQKL